MDGWMEVWYLRWTSGGEIGAWDGNDQVEKLGTETGVGGPERQAWIATVVID